MRGRSGLLEVILAAAPKLTHRHIGVFFAKELLGDRRHEDSHRLGHQPHAFFTGPLLGHAVVVLRDQFTDREPVIPEETLGLFLVPHDATCERWQPGAEVVATAFPEFLGHARRPIRTLRLPAIEQQVFESAAGLLGRILPDRFEHLVDVEVHRLRAHFVALEAFGGGGFGVHPGAGVADPEKRPLACGSVPFRLAGQVDDLFRVGAHERLGRVGKGQVHLHLHARAGHGIVHAGIASGRFESDQGDVLVKSFIRLRLRQGQGNRLSTLHLVLAPNHLLHRLRRLDPWPSRLTPPIATLHRDF